ncbi:type II toxin-antitoxin system VapC family toxin [Candidatus Bathyarchaeota archaeon]|nr:type II toxin-antitoxin system VapC family toxin [Candidatus Bathyarchaeota archaeon]MBS7628770.1 type II toxin-antitoxin system VapC family toxin [Candidatus Bathyarchaeota archaeon]
MVKRGGHQKLERTPKNIVIDASVVAKWFIPEEDSDKASEIMRKYSDGRIDLYAPDLLIYEVANVLRYRPDVTVETLADSIESLIKLQINLIPPSIEIMSEAAAKARALDLSIYDACYIVIAETLATNLVTADMKLYEKCRNGKIVFFLRSLGKEWCIP